MLDVSKSFLRIYNFSLIGQLALSLPVSVSLCWLIFFSLCIRSVVHRVVVVAYLSQMVDLDILTSQQRFFENTMPSIHRTQSSLYRLVHNYYETGQCSNIFSVCLLYLDFLCFLQTRKCITLKYYIFYKVSSTIHRLSTAKVYTTRGA